ncbi:hypothetical protein NE237_029774 [Protea cynaroides]|uniref:Uncharacterized protein n=1 Tax=Protea cynaroides TaxID=273540 RepID=A0A9Q0GRT9_9MAGN|nr:hypothetical protein NE237_029774 [Protea cynaroides]
MGRMIPSHVDSLISPAFSLSILAAWIAATVAIIVSLCGIKSRKSSPSQPKPSSTSSSSPERELNIHNVMTTTTTTRASTATESPLETTTTGEATATDAGSKEYSKEESISRIHHDQQHKRSATNIPKSNFVAPKGNLIKSLSMKIPGSGAVQRFKSRREENHQKEGGRETEKSLWTKTIILGEKCKVPDEEDAIIYDDKGNRIAAYPTRTPRSLPVSRSNSFFYPEGIIPS